MYAIGKHTRFVVLSVISILLLPAMGWASDDDPLTCTSKSNRTTSVAATDGHTTAYDSQGAGGAPEGFDPTPLITTTVTVGGRENSCLVAQLSAHSATGYGFGDQSAVFQVNVDGVPMIGHTTACATSTGVNFACLLLDNNAVGNGIAGHSYHLYREVTPGPHAVEVLFAGCCSGTGAYTGGAVLTLHHP